MNHPQCWLQARGNMDAFIVIISSVQILFLSYFAEPVHARQATIANMNVTADAPVILARVGRNSGMSCSFSPSYPEGAQVYWRRANGTRLTEGRVSVDRRRFRARTTGNRNTYSLRMSRVVPSQTGFYFCGVQLNGVVKEARVNFTVVVPERERIPTSLRAANEQVVGRVGGIAGMSCNYRPRYPQHTQFYWRKQDGTRVATGTSVVYEPGRISTRMREYSPSYSLVIRRLQPSDSGVYICGFEQNGAFGEASVNLRVSVPPQILSDESSDFSLTARRGSDLDIHCIATGTPRPNITWTSVSHRTRTESGAASAIVIGHGPTLTLHDVRRNNISYYRCLADNGIRPTTSKIFFVEVQDLPVVRIANTTVNGVSGGIAFLSCDVIANPMGQSNWIFEGNPVTNSSTHTILRNYIGADEVRLFLTIRPLSDRDFGQYTCLTTNTLGNASGLIHLVRQSGP